MYLNIYIYIYIYVKAIRSVCNPNLHLPGSTTLIHPANDNSAETASFSSNIPPHALWK